MKSKKKTPLIDTRGVGAQIDAKTEEEEVITLKREIKIKGETYRYMGPANKEILDLLTLLEEQELKPSKYKIQEFYRKVQRKLDNYFAEYFVFFGGRVKVVEADFVLFICILVTMIVFLAKSNGIENNKNVVRHSWKRPLADSLSTWSEIFSAYLFVFIYLKNSLIVVALLFFQVLIPALVILYKFNLLFRSERGMETDPQTYFNPAFSIALWIYSFILWGIRTSLKSLYGEFRTALVVSFLHVLIVLYIAWPIIESILISEYVNVTLIKGFSELVLIPVILLLIFIWSFVHMRYFKLPISVIKAAILRISKQIKKGYKKDNKEISQENRIKRFFSRNLHIFSSVIVGGAFLFSEIYLAFEIKSHLLAESVDFISLIMIVFYFFAIPIFIILGISVVVSKSPNSNKYLIIPIVLGTLPMMGFVPLYNYIVDSGPEYQDLAIFVISAPPISAIFWITMIFLGVTQRRYFLIILTFFCFFFLFPLGVLFPLSLIKLFDTSSETVKNIASITTAIGVILVVSIVFLRLLYFFIKGAIKKLKNQRPEEWNHMRFDLAGLSLVNLKNFSYWVNAIGYIFSFATLVVAFYDSPKDETSDEKGTIQSCLVVISLMFLLMNLVIRLKKTYDPSQDGVKSTSLSSKIVDRAERKANIIFQRMKRHKIMKFIVAAGFFLPILGLSPIIALTENRELRSTCLGLIIGVPLCFLVFFAFMQAKNYSGKMFNFLPPIIISLCWCIVFIPFGVLVPVMSSYMVNRGEEYESFVRFTVMSALLLALVGVTTFSIFMNSILNKIEFEKKLKYVVNLVRKMLRTIGVKSDVSTLRRAYEQYYVKKEENFKGDMLKGNPLNEWPISDKDPDKSCSKLILTMEAYKILQTRGVNADFNDLQAQKKNWCEKFIDKICGFKEQKVDELEEFKENEDPTSELQILQLESLVESEIDEDGIFAVEDFLPLDETSKTFSEFVSNSRLIPIDFRDYGEEDDAVSRREIKLLNGSNDGKRRYRSGEEIKQNFKESLRILEKDGKPHKRQFNEPIDKETVTSEKTPEFEAIAIIQIKEKEFEIFK